MSTPTLTTIYQFASDSPWLTFFLAVTAAGLLRALAYLFMVGIHGWPPPEVHTHWDDSDE